MTNRTEQRRFSDRERQRRHRERKRAAGEVLTAEQLAARSACQARYLAAMTYEERIAMHARKNEARRQRMANDPAYAEHVRVRNVERLRARRAAAKAST